MKSLDFGRHAVCGGIVAAILGGCSGQPPVGAPLNTAVGLSAQRSQTKAKYTVLYSFKGYSDGQNPEAGLIDVGGTLYGTTSAGGGTCSPSNECGTAFAITPSGQEKVLHTFNGARDGETPLAGLIYFSGTLYGTTWAGGTNCTPSGGCGTVFALATSGKEKVLHRFGGQGDGSFSFAGLTNLKGRLYGTTYVIGTVFSITTSGKEAVLHYFGGSGDGYRPEATLINVNGTLYGTTSVGGAYARASYLGGTVFAITTSGKETVLHSFGGPGDGQVPRAGLVNVNSTLYGTTWEGGAYDRGTVFAITTSGAETVLHSFGGSGDGQLPQAALINVGGTLYGTTWGGGTNKNGMVFAMTTSGAETIVHNFGPYGSGDGASPEAGLINVKDTLYGTTSGGGKYGGGTIFALPL